MPNPSTLLHHWFEEVWNQGRTEVIDELMAPGAIVHGIEDEHGQALRGPVAFKAFHQKFRGAFPDIHVAIEDSITSADTIAARCVVTATHTGDHLGITATNKPVTFTGMCFVRVKEGKIVEGWNNFDFLKMNQQLGV